MRVSYCDLTGLVGRRFPGPIAPSNQRRPGNTEFPLSPGRSRASGRGGLNEYAKRSPTTWLPGTSLTVCPTDLRMLCGAKPGSPHRLAPCPIPKETSRGQSRTNVPTFPEAKGGERGRWVPAHGVSPSVEAVLAWGSVGARESWVTERGIS